MQETNYQILLALVMENEEIQKKLKGYFDILYWNLLSFIPGIYNIFPQYNTTTKSENDVNPLKSIRSEIILFSLS